MPMLSADISNHGFTFAPSSEHVDRGQSITFEIDPHQNDVVFKVFFANGSPFNKGVIEFPVSKNNPCTVKVKTNAERKTYYYSAACFFLPGIDKALKLNKQTGAMTVNIKTVSQGPFDLLIEAGCPSIIVH